MTEVESQIIASITDQCLQLHKNGKVTVDVMVSTAKNGSSEKYGSECTPRGRHVIRAKIGDGCPIYSVFAGRRPAGEVFSEQLHNMYRSELDIVVNPLVKRSGGR